MTKCKRRKMDESENEKMIRQAKIQYLKKTIPFDMSNFQRIQRNVTVNMRRILMDWLLEVATDLRASDDLFFSAAKLVDAFSCSRVQSRDTYQLLGMTCMMICSKLYEINPIDLSFCEYICDSTYSEEDFMRKEKDILQTFDFKIVSSNIYQLFRDLMDINCNVTITVSMKRLSLFLLEASEIIGLHHHEEIDVVSACLYVACELYSFNHDVVTYYTNMFQRLHSIGEEILEGINDLKKRKLESIFVKHHYDCGKFNLVLPKFQKETNGTSEKV